MINTDSTTTHSAQVIATYGKFSLVKTVSGTQLHCTKRKNVAPIVIGDRVSLKENVIINIHKRTTLLANNDKNIAANIDRIFVVVAVQPYPNLLSIDSYLIKAHSIGITPIIVLNKIDLSSHQYVVQLLQIYANIGYNITQISALMGKNMQYISADIAEHTSVFVGHSGVGKSAIIAYLSGKKIRTNALGADGLGKHTTTHSSLFRVDEGNIIDTPGVREFVISQMEISQIAAGYIEFKRYLGKCKFHNCQHLNEPKCAVKTAVVAGEIHRHRYNNYIQLLTAHL